MDVPSRVRGSVFIAGACAACAAGCSLEPPPAPRASAPVPRADAALPAPPPIPRLAIGGAPSAPPSATPAEEFAGVQWRAEVPASVAAGGEPLITTQPVILGNEVILGRGASVFAYSLATGALVRTAKLAVGNLYAGDHELVGLTAHDEIGIDPATLAPTWHQPRPNGAFMLGDVMLEEPLASGSSPPLPILRRAGDGVQLGVVADPEIGRYGGGHAVLGRTGLVQTRTHVLGIDLATGTIRWRVPGWLGTAANGRFTVGVDAHTRVIYDADGHPLWRADNVQLVLADDTVYALVDGGEGSADPLAATETVAIALPSNTVRWRRPAVFPFAADATWVYAWTLPDERLVLLSAKTGELAARTGIPADLAGASADPLTHDGRAIALFEQHALFAVGARAQAEPVTEHDVYGCLVITGCRDNSMRPAGAAISIGGATAKTDGRGCFRAHVTAGLGPVPFAAHGGNLPAQLDGDFPAAVILGAAPLALAASWIGAGCHDSVPGGFP
jgi:hypothetical protein